MEPKKTTEKPPKPRGEDPNLSPGIENPKDGNHGVAEMGGQGMGKGDKKK